MQLTNEAAELLTDFANTRPDDFKRFESKWGEARNTSWFCGPWREIGQDDQDFLDAQDFLKVQQVVRGIWEGQLRGSEDQLVANGLSLLVPRQEPGVVDSSMSLLHVDWKSGCIWAFPRDLGDYVWLSLLQYSQRLAVCANKDNGCPAPYFIRKKPNQKFCSEVCAAPSQREFKLQWFREHGADWREK